MAEPGSGVLEQSLREGDVFGAVFFGQFLLPLQANPNLAPAPHPNSKDTSAVKPRGREKKGPPDIAPKSKGYAAPISGVTPADQTKERSVHELFTGAFRNKSSM